MHYHTAAGVLATALLATAPIPTSAFTTTTTTTIIRTKNTQFHSRRLLQPTLRSTAFVHSRRPIVSQLDLTTGPDGTPASSPEEDMELTIDIIMGNVNGNSETKKDSDTVGTKNEKDTEIATTTVATTDEIIPNPPVEEIIADSDYVGTKNEKDTKISELEETTTIAATTTDEIIANPPVDIIAESKKRMTTDDVTTDESTVVVPLQSVVSNNEESDDPNDDDNETKSISADESAEVVAPPTLPLQSVLDDDTPEETNEVDVKLETEVKAAAVQVEIPSKAEVPVVVVVEVPSTAVTKSDTAIDKSTPTPTPNNNNRLDNILSTLTSGFPLFVLSAAILGLTRPSTLTWVNNGQLIPLMLSTVMLSMGMTLQTEDFTRVLSSTPTTTTTNGTTEKSNTSSPLTAIPAGVSCQYLIMPLTAYLIGTLTLLPHYPAAFLGLILVGCSPGGTASNLVALIAGADVALSVVLTSISTVLATGVTPILVRALAGRSDIELSRWALCVTTGKVVLAPVAVGMWVRSKVPKVADAVGRVAPFLGVLLVALMCGGVVRQNAAFALLGGSVSGGGVSAVSGAGVGVATGGASLLVRIIGAVLGLHSVGFLMGYLSSKKIFGLSERAARTISIETGMQNSALAVVLARSIMGGEGVAPAVAAMACLPGAFSATAHSCLGSVLAVYWRWVDRRKVGGEVEVGSGESQ